MSHADEGVTPRYVSTEMGRRHSVAMDCSDAPAQHTDIITWFKDGRQLDEGLQ